jgi:hypothetical protein
MEVVVIGIAMNMQSIANAQFWDKKSLGCAIKMETYLMVNQVMVVLH